MADLNNSARKMLRATYTPIKPIPLQLSKLKKAWEKLSLIRDLRITPEEVAKLKKLPKAKLPAINAVESLVNQRTPASAFENAPLFAEVEWDSLIFTVNSLAKLREQDLEMIQETYKAINEAYEKKQRQIESKTESKGTLTHSKTIETKHTNLDEIKSTPQFQMKNLNDMFEWAVKNHFMDKEARKLLDLLAKLFTEQQIVKKADLEGWAINNLKHTYEQLLAMQQYSVKDPVGLLHLERLNFVPSGIERGELIHSVPLSPGEEVNITHKEWSNTSEEFSRIVTDYMEAYSEEGVAEKSELTQSTSSQEQHSSAFNTGVSASGGYGPVSITASVGYSTNDSASSSEQSARKHSMDTTHKASARSKKEHKVSFKVASAAGTEDQQVRKIRNPFPDKATRVDYYQLVRKWRVDLYRYGLRLTYDLMIPEPGSALLSRLIEIQEINRALELGFGDTADESSPAYFGLKLEELDDMSWNMKAEEFGVIIDSPPLKEIIIPLQNLNPGAFDEDRAKYEQHSGLAFDIPDGYEVEKAEALTFDLIVFPGHQFGSMSDPEAAYVHIIAPYPPESYIDVNSLPLELPPWKGSPFVFLVRHRWVYGFSIIVRITAKRSDEAFRTWQLKSWQAIRDVAQTHYEQYRQSLKDRLARLQAEIGAQDPLSLRKIEREEVMKCVLRWLFGPDLDFTTHIDASVYSDQNIQSKSAAWKMNIVQLHAQIIKFLHHSIEWENMLYFLYPYFWSYPGQDNERWQFKKYLSHPDLMHQTFLKSGAARVVLTIRPGFEKDFVTFLETGKLDPLKEDHPYFSITNEMEAYAKVNYPGIKPANPVEDARPLLIPKQRKAWKEMQQIMTALDKYRDNHPTYPTTEQGLAALENVPLTDPWNNPYIYTSPGLYHDEYDLASYGSDGVLDADAAPDAEEEAADITSWAEANLIGRWYEYTPTSALDIAFNETEPSE